MSNIEHLISFIVPIYNVELYLRDCLDSLIAQTYRNIEIILVDDGSTDGSLRICERYLKKDMRFRLISKENGGLSSARNRGIEEARGEYIGFIDSDDIVHPKFAEVLLHAILANGYRIAACDYVNKISRMSYSGYRYEKLIKSDAISGLLDDGGYKCFACNKMFDRSCFDGIRFPEGKMFEDIKIMYSLFSQVDGIIHVKCPLYYYRVRRGSISRSKFSKGNFYLVESINYIMREARLHKEYDFDRLMLGYMSYYMGFVRRGISNGADINKEIRRLIKLIKQNRKKICRVHSNIRNIKKIELFVFAYFLPIYRIGLRFVG